MIVILFPYTWIGIPVVVWIYTTIIILQYQKYQITLIIIIRIAAKSSIMSIIDTKCLKTCARAVMKQVADLFLTVIVLYVKNVIVSIMVTQM